MSRITQDTIDRIFETARIEEVIGDFVQLKRAGSNLKGLSPFNNERSPSFMVSPAKQIFKDFSSGKGGSVVTFLMELEHFTYPEALRWLAKRYNIEIEEDQERTPEQEIAANARESVFLITEFAKKWFEQQLQSEEGRQIGLAYFRERGFTDETIATFGLGYSPRSKDAFSTEALAKGYSPEVLLESGISLKREDGSWYDRFWGRVIFPIYSLSGRVLGFGGRILQNDAKAAKYLNSPENPIYHKSNVLFGLFQAKKTIVKNDEALLVEGYTDVLSLFQIGVENVVASSGTALTEDQIRLIRRYTQNVTILYDGDAAGIRASFRGIDMFLQEGMNVRVVLFPDGDDPDSYARKTSPIEFKEFIQENRTDFIRFKAGLLMKETEGDPIRKAEIIRDIVSSIAKIPDEISRDVFVKESAKILDMDVKVLYAELGHMIGKDLRDQVKKGVTPKMEVVKTQQVAVSPESAAKDSLHYEQESALIRLLIHHGNDSVHDFPQGEGEQDFPTVAQILYLEFHEEDLSLKNNKFQSILDLCFKALLESGRVPEPMWYNQQEDTELAQVAAELAENHSISPQESYGKRSITVKLPEKIVYKHILEVAVRLKDVKIDERKNQIQEEMKHTEDEEKLKQLRITFAELLALRNQVSKKLHRVVPG